MPLSDYLIIDEMSAGGMARVCLARSRKNGRLVVIKRPISLRHEDADRIRDEGKIGLHIRHPAVVETIETFEEDGEPVVVVAYMPGLSIGTLRRRAPLPPQVVAHVGEQIAQGLHAIHEIKDDTGKNLNVLHRDVSEGNIIIENDGQARLIDLGIARWSQERSARTQTGTVTGTLRYISPEVLTGNTHSAASEMWALGMVLWEGALGRPIYQGAPAKVLFSIVSDPPMQTQGHEKVDARLRFVLAQFLDPDPSVRVASASEAAALFANLQNELGPGQDMAAHLVREAMALPIEAPTDQNPTIAGNHLESEAPETGGQDALDLSDQWVNLFAQVGQKSLEDAPVNSSVWANPSEDGFMGQDTLVSTSQFGVDAEPDAKAPAPRTPSKPAMAGLATFDPNARSAPVRKLSDSAFRPPKAEDFQELTLDPTARRQAVQVARPIGEEPPLAGVPPKKRSPVKNPYQAPKNPMLPWAVAAVVLLVGGVSFFLFQWDQERKDNAIRAQEEARKEELLLKAYMNEGKDAFRKNSGAVPSLKDKKAPPKKKRPKTGKKVHVPAGYPPCYREGKTVFFAFSDGKSEVITQDVAQLPKKRLKSVKCITSDP